MSKFKIEHFVVENGKTECVNESERVFDWLPELMNHNSKVKVTGIERVFKNFALESIELNFDLEKHREKRGLRESIERIFFRITEIE